MSIIDKINKENDIKNIDKKDYQQLSREIRSIIIDAVSKNGGHLASNFGTVELTMALHLTMNFPTDKIVWDVGHQSYTHKILTGRKKELESLRTLGGISGFPKVSESPCDAFNTGHSSTSLSAAIGFAVARKLNRTNERIAAVIGDGSFTGGMAYEALNNLGQLKAGCVIILNDNDMSIDKNVGGMSEFLSKVRVGHAYNEFKMGLEDKLMNLQKVGPAVAKTLKRSKDTFKYMFAISKFFEEFGITYIGPIDGHDIGLLVKTLNNAFELNKPIILHVKTQKGRGYRHAVNSPDCFHSVAPFDIASGKQLNKKHVQTYTDVFGKNLVSLGKEYSNMVVITAAMAKGTGVNFFQDVFPDRVFDVGIAEQHAVTFAAGLATAKMIPIVAVYSSFLQRAYDQILHDVCLQNLHVIFAVDRSGLVGQDGATHQGIYDVSFLSHMPNMVIMAPKNKQELISMMKFALKHNGPIAIKYSRGEAYLGLDKYNESVTLGKCEIVFEGSQIAIMSYGNMMEEALKLHSLLQEKDNVNASLINARFIRPFDKDMIKEIAKQFKTLVIMEENIYEGSLTQKVMAYILSNDLQLKVINGAISEDIVEHGSVNKLRELLSIDAYSMYDKIKGLI